MVARALDGRMASAIARAHGLSKDAIRNVVYGHEPRLGRADAVCHALGLTFVLGATRSEQEAHAVGEPSAQGAPTAHGEPVRDVQLAELLSRLADLWETIPARERVGFALAMASLLEFAGARAEGARGRSVESLGWRERGGDRVGGDPPDPA